MMKHRKLIFSAIANLLVFSAAIAAYSLNTPGTSSRTIEYPAQIQTGYDYKAVVTPNILYPDGGTVEAGRYIFPTITTSIPVHLKSTVTAGQEVTIKGTHAAELIIGAGEMWEKRFPLEQEQSIQQKGALVPLIDTTFTIDMEQVKGFILQVERETGIRSAIYTLDIAPNIKGTLDYAGIASAINVTDKLSFRFSFDQIERTSETTFNAAIPLSKTEVATNTFPAFGSELPLGSVRLASSAISAALLLALVLLHLSGAAERRSQPKSSAVDNIQRKYGSRVIPVTQKLNTAQKSILSLDSFTSIVKIADEKELPIFSFNDYMGERVTYFVVDGDCLYNFETSSRSERASGAKKGAAHDQAYAKS
ncbi:DUF5305 family protein [Paenibacillus silvisoli]|uniref:DUF5305 family protein n=1 Tax=Paenibacillus silvisoli TaxID=3110539 RepID=UPI002803E0C1|nr:DUF5305 family protein [Paenibacillus silvisoli]